MDVPPHPHIGLQTVSWLLEDEVLGYPKPRLAAPALTRLARPNPLS